MKPIGGELELDAAALIDLRGGTEVHPATGRAAIELILAHLRIVHGPVAALVPDYLCQSIVDAVGPGILFYPVGPDLRPEAGGLTRALAKVTGARPVVLLIDYFGLVDLAPVIAQVRAARRDAVVLEDDVQAPSRLSSGRGADFSFTSYRKSFPVPDGAEIMPPLAFDTEGEMPGAPFARVRLAAALIKASALEGAVEDSMHLELFARGENLLATTAATIPASALGRALLARIDRDLVAVRRRANFRALATGLSHLGLTPIQSLGADAVPLCMPILVTDRDRLRASLREDHVYCPVHWPEPPGLPEPSPSSRLRYAHELSLPIDQRYDESDMARLAGALERRGARPA